MINTVKIRKDFPILDKKILNQKDLIYFDTAASAQKPEQVISEMDNFYRQNYSNVSRGIHTLSVESTCEKRIVVFVFNIYSDQLTVDEALLYQEKSVVFQCPTTLPAVNLSRAHCRKESGAPRQRRTLAELVVEKREEISKTF